MYIFGITKQYSLESTSNKPITFQIYTNPQYPQITRRHLPREIQEATHSISLQQRILYEYAARDSGFVEAENRPRPYYTPSIGGDCAAGPGHVTRKAIYISCLAAVTLYSSDAFFSHASDEYLRRILKIVTARDSGTTEVFGSPVGGDSRRSVDWWHSNILSDLEWNEGNFVWREFLRFKCNCRVVRAVVKKVVRIRILWMIRSVDASVVAFTYLYTEKVDDENFPIHIVMFEAICVIHFNSFQTQNLNSTLFSIEMRCILFVA